MKSDRRMMVSVIWIVLGAVLFGCGFFEAVDTFWSGMGGGLLAVGVLQMIRYIRYKNDADYREAVEVQNNDERNRFLGGKAWAWAGYLYVMINAVAAIALRVLGYDDLSTWAGFSICLIVLLYWVSYLLLRKKY